METLKKWITPPFEYVKTLLKWLVLSSLVGIVGGFLGSIFHIAIDYVTEVRHNQPLIILLLPIGGLIITAMYHLFKKSGTIDTNRVFDSASGNEKVPLAMAPLIFISTCITHLFGGSAGREGAALQLGGSIGYNIGKVLKLSKSDLHLIVMTGMSSVFSALFGTPLTAAFFALEVTNVGRFFYSGLVPCLVSSAVSCKIASLMGLSGVHFAVNFGATSSISAILSAIPVAILCAAVSILFCITIKKCEHYADTLLPNRYLKAVVGSVIICILTFSLRTYDYNGAGMDVISRAIDGSARYEAFLLKIIFTAITIAAGFKGGEIVPAFFVGSTFGCALGTILGIDPTFTAAIGFVSVFCGVVNCPIASVFLALEVFGADSLLTMAIVCSISYLMSGNFGLYKSQKIIYSKLSEEEINESTK